MINNCQFLYFFFLYVDTMCFKSRLTVFKLAYSSIKTPKVVPDKNKNCYVDFLNKTLNVVEKMQNLNEF